MFGQSLLNDSTLVDVLSQHRSDWEPTLKFFNWISRGSHSNGYTPGTDVYNEILGILGEMKKLEEMHQLLDEMSKREGLKNENTYQAVAHRYVDAHNTEAAIEMFEKRKNGNDIYILILIHVDVEFI